MEIDEQEDQSTHSHPHRHVLQPPPPSTPSISYRQFYEAFEERESKGQLLAQRHPKRPDLLQRIQDSLVGRFQGFDSPLGGLKPIVYADWTASGRQLHFIEDYLRIEVMPFYGNTHTTTSITGVQTTLYRHEARQIIAESVNARVTGKAADDIVLFTGSGCTSAITKMVHILGLNCPLPAEATRDDRPIIFCGPFAHHSNLLPWRESVAEVVTIRAASRTGVDLRHLEQQLQRYAHRSLKVGAFTAASNITGLCVDVDAVTGLLHNYGALAFWDYASAAPYIKVDMNPVGGYDPETGGALNLRKDAVFISGHKFVGGPGTPGILVVKKALLANEVPERPGGGTVFFVTKEDHRYLSNREEREEGGTPDIMGSIRLGLCFRLKDTVGAEYSKEREALFAKKTLESLCNNPKIVVLGDAKTPRLPIFAFLVRHGPSYLHYNFVCALLNDLFGIQSRGGCQCAGPYGQELLGLQMEDSRLYEAALLDKMEILRPGFSRLSLTYYHSDAEVDYIISAIHHVADHGYKFLPHYRFNHRTGEWRHHSRFTRFPSRRWLSTFDFERLPMPEKGGLAQWDCDSEVNLFSKMMQGAEELTSQALQQQGNLGSAKIHISSTTTVAVGGGGGNGAGQGSKGILGEAEALRWFVYPEEVAWELAHADGGANGAVNGNGNSNTKNLYGPGQLRPTQCHLDKESPRYQYRELMQETLSPSPSAAFRSLTSSSPSPIPSGEGAETSKPF